MSSVSTPSPVTQVVAVSPLQVAVARFSTMSKLFLSACGEASSRSSPLVLSWSQIWMPIGTCGVTALSTIAEAVQPSGVTDFWSSSARAVTVSTPLMKILA